MTFKRNTLLCTGTMGQISWVQDPTHQRLHLVKIQIHFQRGPEVGESWKGFPAQNNRPKNSGSARKGQCSYGPTGLMESLTTVTESCWGRSVCGRIRVPTRRQRSWKGESQVNMESPEHWKCQDHGMSVEEYCTWSGTPLRQRVMCITGSRATGEQLSSVPFGTQRVPS